MISSFSVDIQALIVAVYRAILVAIIVTHIIGVMILGGMIAIVVLFFTRGWYHAGAFAWFGGCVLMFATAVVAAAYMGALSEMR
ncbi:MAG: hypothetical protein M1524_03895 [Patescibacteria group bacterium]|nr:hypothetical protein [Patescibacteria group bacterium]